jgi:lysyl-tRNA synthetase class I
MTQTNNTNAVETAHARISNIQQAIVDGNTKLTSGDLAAARSDLEFAQLRESARIERERRADLSRRIERTKEFEARLKVAETDTALETAQKRFEKALSAYAETADAHNERLSDIQAEMMAEGLQENGTSRDGIPIEVKFPSGEHQPMRIGDAQVRFASLRQPVKEFVGKVLGD